ncbi:GAF domain-containing protein [Pseudorhodoferax sp. Leaf267]|uniref:GAF domain-containing protein n=1 Tax=Pseudorhodoferax sp. Leaf267 TaxID=1736316 RepID=UPI0006F27E08|nr:GAF domain-containing protein [Pseudorhodoferax sp. Leaf267]KQP21757.1 hypothetical protein ASF43_25995 [Pseudorhodoferax sp. Leaf267]
MASLPPPASTPVPPRCTLTLLLMHEVMRHVARGGAPELLMREMLHLMSELLGLHHGRVVLADGGALDPHMPTARIRLAYGLTREEVARGIYAWGEGVTGRVLATGRAMVVQDIDAEPQFLARAVARAQLPAGPLAFLAVPIECGLRIVGVLACHRGAPCERLLEHDLGLLQILATLAGQALQRHELLLQQLTRTLGPPLVRAYLPARLHSAQDLERVLALHDGVQSRAAQALGLTVRQFSYRLRKARS